MLGSAKSKPARFFRMALAAAFFSLVAVAFSAYVRLSDADIGCPDGPACGAAPITPAATQAALSARNMKPRKWTDMVARYIAGALGLLLIRLAVLGWQLRRRSGQQAVIPVVTLFLVFALTGVGVFTYDLENKPVVMMIQYLGGLLVLALLWWIVLREQRLFRSVASTPLVRALRRRSLVALALVLLAITLGAWSMTNYAGPACPDFPTCQGEYYPGVDYFSGLVSWAEVGLAFDRTELDLSSAAAIHIAHRASALIALLYLGWLSLRLLRVGMQENVCRYGLLLLVMLSFATALGIIEAVGNLPLIAAVGHSVAAAILLLTLVTLYHVLRAPRVSK